MGQDEDAVGEEEGDCNFGGRAFGSVRKAFEFRCDTKFYPVFALDRVNLEYVALPGEPQIAVYDCRIVGTDDGLKSALQLTVDTNAKAPRMISV